MQTNKLKAYAPKARRGFIAAVTRQGGRYRVRESDLYDYFIPKKAREISIDYLLNLGKGIGYRKSAAGYLFRRI